MRGKLLASCAMAITLAALAKLATAADLVAPTPAATANHGPSKSELLQQKLASLDRLQTEVAELREATGTPHSIYVSVQVLEVSLTKLRKLGIGFEVDPGDVISAAGLGQLQGNDGAYAAPDEVNHNGLADSAEAASGDSTTACLDSLVQKNVARVLTSPFVVTISGEPATLFVGEKFPLPRTAPDAPVEFQEAGIRHDVLAESLGNGRVRLHIRPRISTAGPPEFEVDGVPVRSLRVQQCELSCETTFGETVVLSGLVTERIEAQIHNGGRVVEDVNEIALWVVVRAEDASNVPQRETRVLSATYVAP